MAAYGGSRVGVHESSAGFAKGACGDRFPIVNLDEVLEPLLPPVEPNGSILAAVAAASLAATRCGSRLRLARSGEVLPNPNSPSPSPSPSVEWKEGSSRS